MQLSSIRTRFQRPLWWIGLMLMTARPAAADDSSTLTRWERSAQQTQEFTKGVYSFNRYGANAVYQPLFAGHIDMLSFDTGGYDARLDPGTGALVSQIRSYKMARQLGACVDDGIRDELRAAVHMAFGYQKPV